MKSANQSPDLDTSRISVSAHYTGYIWYKHGLSAAGFATGTGRFANAALTPINAFLRLVAGADIDIFLLQRHSVIDHQVRELIEQHGIEQIVELASGLSPRGYRIKQQYPHIRYIEGDLPGMAARKRELLGRVGLAAGHDVVECNILQEDGPTSIAAVLAGLDTSKPTLIITEGLVNYFDLPVIRSVWARMAQGLKQFPQGYYITDLYPDFADHPSYRYVKMAQKLVGLFTRGQWPLHYSNDGAIRKGFSEDGFEQVDVLDPASFYGLLNLPEVKIKTLVRIIRCKVSSE
ncbi:class I SAM-dependent methyltransferase [Thalassolituus sp.]|jgi:O-methyltransferase involved in polyketide biosynthesis|uniref:class I SAM-dependent methyltransferase n=1 Tax=Thalassolituus sp. TaxID=2030822 RepID=UPI002A824259|nr:class I SAM-dependent methyltransferase [Thalassolituus sp.]